MAKQTVNIGTVANDGTGDDIRDAFDKLNDNFNEVYSGYEYTGTQNFNGTSATHSSTSDYTWALATNQVFALTASENFTIVFSGAVDGATYILKLIQDGSGSRAVSWGANFKFEGGTAPTQTTGAGDISVWSFYSDGTYLYGTGLIDLQ